jgi:hypothetical protein
MIMTWLRRCTLVLAALTALVGCPGLSSAQAVADADRQILAGPWIGIWNSDTMEYGASVSLSVAADGSIEGKIDWTLRKSGRADYASKIGMKGVEYVRGKFQPGSSVVSFDGYRLDDPNKILGTDRYRLILSENRATLGGLTWDHGSWGGRIFLKR